MPAIPALTLALDPATGNLLPVNANAVLFGSVLTLVVIELVVSIRAGRWNRRDSTTSVGVGIGYLAIKVIAAGSAAVASYIWLYRHVGIFDWSWRSPLTWLAYWIIGDFAYYWIHRAEHRVSVLWASHQVHHSAESLTFVTAVRMPWTEVFYKPFTGLWAPLLGFPPIMYPVMGAFSLMVGQLQHTEMISRLGWFDRWFTTPSNHRVHHASNPQYLDKNFGGHTMIWDRLFGTYEPEVEVPSYGLTTPLEDQRVRRVALGGFPQLIRALRSAGSLRRAGRLALAPPTQ
ncbi:MAG: sterol desaturase family protein [Candidatus Microthrix sp.]|nr:sterol desaturase family protein [Candidatus Microthrix sp.]MBK6437989.1 sterol desaturase family protein [Candidatus Microthrix sp.]